MPKSELQWQTDIIRSCKARCDGTGKKLSHKFSAGVPDLLLAIPGLGNVLAEVKLIRRKPSQRSVSYKVRTTQLQRKTLRDFSSAGGLVCVMVVVTDDSPMHWSKKAKPMLIVADSQATSVDVDSPHVSHWSSEIKAFDVGRVLRGFYQVRLK